MADMLWAIDPEVGYFGFDKEIESLIQNGWDEDEDDFDVDDDLWVD